LNIKEYISTGVVESYVLGELSGKDLAEFEANIAAYPELREELARTETTLGQFAMRSAIHPASYVKMKVMSAASRPGSKTTPAGKSLQMWQYATAASVTFALAAAIAAYTFWSNWRTSEDNLAELRALNEQVAQDYDQVSGRLDKIESDLRIYGDPAFQKVVMKGTEGAPDALASIYWNKTTSETFLSIQHLRDLTREQQYQLWAIVDGSPVDMGVFDSFANAESGLLQMKNITNAAAFAVTIEPRGGKTAPSLQTMQAVGTVGKS
jgi:anti-sigma-K factor RskA